MSREPENIQKQIDRADQDFRRKYSFNCDMPEVNNPIECVLLHGFLTSESKLSPEMMADLRQKWQEMYANTGNTMMILNKGITFHESSNTSVEMQLNENKARNNELSSY